MDDQFAKLEARVDGAIDLIRDLRGENARLHARCQELERSAAAAADSEARLQRELATARDVAAQAAEFEAKRRLIEERVGGLLEKLEAMGQVP